jgi:hypothetical protein
MHSFPGSNLFTRRPEGFPKLITRLKTPSYPTGNDILAGLILKYDLSDKVSYPGHGTLLRDLNGGLYNGTVFNNPVFEKVERFETLQFTASLLQYVGLPVTGLPSGNAPRSVSVWFKGNNVAIPGLVFTYGAANIGQAFSVGYFSGLLVFSAFGLNLFGPSAVNGVWYNLSATYNGTTARLYLNGIQINSGDFAINTINSVAYIGRQVNGGEYMSGNVSKVLFYNRALSASEISQLFWANNGRYGI